MLPLHQSSESNDFETIEIWILIGQMLTIDTSLDCSDTDVFANNSSAGWILIFEELRYFKVCNQISHVFVVPDHIEKTNNIPYSNI